MALLLPSRHQCLPRMTSGERRVALRIEDKLDDDYLAWYDVPVGPKQRQPDFVVLHPNRGLLVLEVKDWKLETLHSIDRSSAVLATERGLVTVPNPLVQARAYALELNMALQRDPLLRFPEGHRLQGKCRVPWGHGVVLANVTRGQFDSHDLGDVLPGHLVICRDEMTETVDPEAFEERLWAMFSVCTGDVLTLPQIDRIRWHLYPEVRVNAPLQGDLLSDQTLIDRGAPLPDLVRVLDLQQEQLARSLGDGHRVIHGVAGSGKTMLLAYRCLHLARQTDQTILVLCFNKTLASRLQQLMAARGVSDRVSVRNFHAWCHEMLRTYHVPLPPKSGHDDLWFDQMVQAVCDGVEARAIPRGQYAAVLIDEGHDFQPDWLRLAAQMVDPRTNSLLLLYDDAQSIYDGGKRRRFTFASVGIQAVGRTTILRLNYRNTCEILALARSLAGTVLNDRDEGDDSPCLIAPESAGRHGPEPDVRVFSTPELEARYIAGGVRKWLDNGHDPDQIAVLYRDARQGRRIERALRAERIPLRTAFSSADKRDLFRGEPAVRLLSMHSSKGLEFDTVFVSADAHASDREDAVTEARLLYVAMTRALTHLTLTRVGQDAAADAPLPQVVDGPA